MADSIQNDCACVRDPRLQEVANGTQIRPRASTRDDERWRTDLFQLLNSRGLSSASGSSLTQCHPEYSEKTCPNRLATSGFARADSSNGVSSKSAFAVSTAHAPAKPGTLTTLGTQVNIQIRQALNRGE